MNKLILFQIYKNLKPYEKSFEKRLAFQKFCTILVEDFEEIKQSDVDEYTSEEFLYEGYTIAYEKYKMEIKEYNTMIDKEILYDPEEKKFFEEEREKELTNMKYNFDKKIRKIENIKHFLTNLPSNIIITYCIYKLVKMLI